MDHSEIMVNLVFSDTSGCWINFILKVFTFKKKLLLIIYSPPCHPRCPCHYFFSQREIKVFDENTPGFFSI